ncbi:MAG TPA: translesion DNA synthesis-associated protein ImuA [Rheinheimera sp.]|uniref:translesion DNA synthesis-associated protein ImuA n=1 Tax=Rheinheimera sp. TaxID=1869214 RepID=UPI002F9304A4
MSALLEQLTRRQLLWHGNSQQAAYQAVTSGYAELDKQLAGGFPANGLVDIQTEQGIGELRLLLPYLQQQHQDGRLLVMISPPAEPCADMLAGAGINLAQLLVISVKNNKEALWAAEQCLQSGCAAVVLMWQVMLRLAQARRLQLAAEQGNASLFLLRRPQAALSLPVNLSLTLAAHPYGVLLNVNKRKGGWPAGPFLVDMQCRWPALSYRYSSQQQVQRRAG